MTATNYSKAFSTLSNNLDIFIEEVKAKKSSLMATEEWSVKDELCHIVFWHQAYAANYKALAEKRTPSLLSGPGYKLNKEGVAKLRKYSITELIKMVRIANSSLYESIVEARVPQMTYKQNGRVYKTEEFLELVARHLATHTKQVKRAK